MENNTMGMQEPKGDMADAGRGTDNVMAHLSLGEVVIPRAFMDDPQVMQMLQQIFEAGGADINEFTVGHEANKINPETGYPEFGFFRRVFNAISRLGGPTLNRGFKGFTDGVLSNLVLAGNYLLPGSSAITSNLVSKGAQKNLNSTFGKISNAITGLAGSGVGSSFTGIPSASSIGAGYSGLADTLGLGDVYNSASGALSNLTSGIGDQFNNLYNGSALQSTFKSGGDVLNSIGINTGSDSLGSGVAANAGGGASSYGGTVTASNAALPWLTNESTGANNMNYASPIASALLGRFTNNKAEKQLLRQQEANKALYAPYLNFQFNPGDLTQDPGYQFNLAEGNRALDRAQLARGGYFSGNALREAQTFGQGLADNTFNAAFNRALQTNEAGLRGAGALAGVNDNIGNIRAGSTVNSGNLYSGALGSILGGNSFTNTGALQGGTNDWLSNYLRQLQMQRATA